MIYTDRNSTSSCTSTISTGCINSKPKTQQQQKKRVRFCDDSNKVHYVTSVLSILSKKEISNLWLTKRDWQRIQQDLQHAVERRCPTVQNHQPSFAAKRKELIRRVYFVVLREQYYFRREMLDTFDVDRTSYEIRTASFCKELSKKSRHAAYHAALRLEAEVAAFSYCVPTASKQEEKTIYKEKKIVKKSTRKIQTYCCCTICLILKKGTTSIVLAKQH